MTTRSIYVITLLFFLFNSGQAQYNDFGSWNAFKLKKELSEKVKVSASIQFRLNENLTQLRSIHSDLDVSYDLWANSKIAFTYRIGNKKQVEDYYLMAQRFSLEFSTKRDYNEIELGYRLKGQWSNNDLESEDYSLDYYTGIRNKISLERKLIRRTNGWTSFELFSNQNDEQQFYISDWRWKIGVDRKLKKRHYLSLGFMVQRELQTNNPVTDYVVLLGYDWELKKRKKKSDENSPSEAID